MLNSASIVPLLTNLLNLFFLLPFLALQESLVPNGDGSEVKMSYGDDDVIDMTGDLHEVADIKTLVGKPGLLDKVQGNFKPT